MAQPALKPHIGLNSMPNDTDSICSYTVPIKPDMTFDSSPFFAGDTIADFTLYNLDGGSMNIATLLSNGKPVVIVALNYTCPYVRNKVSIYNDILDNYADEVTIIGIYQLEAHPDDDYSPNSGRFGNVSVNERDGIVVNQHKTYSDRKAVAKDFIDDSGLRIPVYMDGPCNEWWTNFGPGPSTGYIIKPNGTVFVKQGWFDKYANGHEIYCDLDSLFGRKCDGTLPTGQFEMILTTRDTVYGPVGATIDLEADLINNSGGDVLIDIERNQNNLDMDWESAICADVCLIPSIDTYTFLLQDSDTQHFWMHFYSSPNSEGAGHTKMVFRNANDFSNQYVQDFYAFSSSDLSSIKKVDRLSFSIYPNPITESATISTQSNEEVMSIIIYSFTGEVVRYETQLSGSEVILETRDIVSGLYFLEVISRDGVIGRQKIMIQ